MSVYLPEFELFSGEAISREPVIVALKTGGFLAVWQSTDSQGAGLKAQLLDGMGKRIGSVFQVNTIATNQQTNPAVTVLNDGRVMVSWDDTSLINGDDSGTSVQARIFSTDGLSISGGQQFLISDPNAGGVSPGGGTLTVQAQYNSQVFGLLNDEYAVVYTEDFTIRNDPLLGTYSAKQLVVRIFNSNGSQKEQKIITQGLGSSVDPDASVAVLDNGNFAVTSRYKDEQDRYGFGQDVYVTVMSPTGEYLYSGIVNNGGAGLQGNQYQSKIAALAGGGFVVTWYDEGTTNIEAQVYRPNNNGQIERSGNVISVNSVTNGIQSQPVIAALPDGRFVIAWVDTSNVSSQAANIKYRIFNGDHTPYTGEITIDERLAGNQLMPAIKVLADGRFVIGWADETGAPSSRGKIVDFRTSAINISGTNGHDSYVGSNVTALGDRIDGKDGNDTLWGGNGSDTLIGGNHDDVLYGDSGADSLDGGSGTRDVATYEYSDIVDPFGNGTGVILHARNGGTGGDAAGDRYNGIEIFIGTNFDDSITGEENDSFAYDEEFRGGLGNDRLKGGAGFDTLRGGDQNDTLDGGLGDDKLYGDAGDDVMSGGQGKDRFEGGGGYDAVTYESAGGRVTVDLTNGLNNAGEAVGDEFFDIDAIRLSQYDDKFTGDNGSNEVGGNGGNDTLSGGGGGDTLEGGAHNDLVDGGTGSDLVYGQDGNDTLYGGDDTEADTLWGGAGDDSMYGGGGADTFYGEQGYNYVSYERSKGAVTIDRRTADGSQNGGDALGDRYFNVNEITGTAFADRYYGSTGSGDAGWDVFHGGDGNDIIEGFNGYSILFGDKGDDRIEGGADSDILYGGAGNDTLRGGGDNDIYHADAGDRIEDSAGTNDQLYATANGKYTLVDAGIEQVTIQGDLDNVHVIASSGGTKIVGNALANTLEGGAGSDTLEGGNGSDTYIVVSGNDLVDEKGTGTGDIDTVLVSGVAAYTLASNVENLKANGAANINLTGNNLANEITGNAAVNIINGGIGNDTIRGGGGADILDGGDGNDIYIIESVADTEATINDSSVAPSFANKDRVRTSVSYTLVTETVEELEAKSGSSHINLTGNSLNNLIIGNSGDNILDGGKGNDTLQGGHGHDTYLVDSASDIVDESKGDGGILDNDIVKVKNGLSYALDLDTTLAHIERLEAQDYFGKEAMNLAGNGLSQTIVGNDGKNRIDGRGGADTMYGRGGDDTYVVDSTDDTVVEQDPTLVGGGRDKVITSVDYTLTAHVEELEASGTSALNLKGNNLDNIITGNSAANEIDGGGGVDTMKGGDGSDTYIVNDSNDVIEELSGSASGYDTVRTSASYVLSANIERLEATGTGNVNLTGNNISNLIIGNDGNNQLDGKDGEDTLQGGRGSDIYIVNATNDVVEEIEGQSDGIDEVQTSVSYTLSRGVEILRATSNQGLILTGNSDATGNQIYGAAGGDTLSGGVDTAVDTLAGGSGSDVYYIDGTVKDIVQEKAGEGTRDEVITSVSYALTDHVEVLTASGTGDIDLTGNNEANTITGNSGNNSIDGGTGADTMDGRAGNDTYNVDHADDKVVEGENAGNDTIITKISYSIGNDVYVETLKASGTADQQINLTGNAHSNTLIGHSGANVLNGGAGADRMEGGDGDDIYYVDNVDDVVVDTSGNDTVITKFTTVLTPNDAIEHLTAADGAQDADGTGIDFTGNDAINRLTGNELSNKLNGGGGDDILDGKDGADIMEGGLGDDTFYVDNLGDVVTDVSGNDTIITNLSMTLASDSPIENLKALAGIAGLTLTGNAGANKLTANDSGTVLDGGKGADTMEGGSGDDTYWIRDLTDVVLQDKGGSNDTAHLFRGLYTDAQWNQIRIDLANLGIERIIEHTGTGDTTRPTDITLTSTSIREDARALDVVGVLGVVDVAGGPYDYQITGDPDGKFDISVVGGQVRLILRDGATLDREADASHTVTVLVTDRDSGLTYPKEFTITVDNVNEVANAITLTGGDKGNASVDENAELNTIVGVLGNNDPDVGDTFTYTFVGGSNNGTVDPLGRFKIVEVDGVWQIVVNNPALLDAETSGSHTVLVRVRDRDGQIVDRNVTVTVNNLNEAPRAASISSGAEGDGSVDEGAGVGTVVGVLSATDPDTGTGTGLTYAIETDPTGGKLVLEGNEIQLAGQLDFEANDPNLLTEAGTGRKYYNVVVRVTDGGSPPQSRTATVKVYVNDVAEGPDPVPTGVSISQNALDELAADGTVVGRLSTIGGIAGADYIFTLHDDLDGRFYIENGEIRVGNGIKLDFEDISIHALLVNVSLNGTVVGQYRLDLFLQNILVEGSLGSDEGDVLRAGEGDDQLNGAGGNDTLYGSFGSDVLIGEAGEDTFVFDTLLSETNIDTLSDFNPAEDKIQLSQSIFQVFETGALPEGALTIDFMATTFEHFIIYEPNSGALMYDLDAAGPEEAVVFAYLPDNLQLTYMNFIIV